MLLDALLDKLNPHGPYQILAWTLLAIFNCFPPAWHSFSIGYIAFFPSGFTCSFSDQENITLNSEINFNLTYQYGFNDTNKAYCVRPNKELLSYIDGLNNGSRNNLPDEWQEMSEPCPVGSHQYSTADPVHSSIVTDFNLVCSRELIFIAICAAEGIGEIIGCLIFGWLADRLGRIKAYFLAAATLFIGGLGCALAINWQMVAAFRAVSGVGLTGVNNVGFVLSSEMFPPKQRTFFATLHEMVWALAVVSLVGVGYFLRDWRYVCWAITLPILLMIPLWWFVQESLHWLLSSEISPEARLRSSKTDTDNVERAKKTVRWIAKFNKISRPDNIIESSSIFQGQHAHTGVASEMAVAPAAKSGCQRCHDALGVFSRLFATPRIRYITISVTLLWFANSLAYYGLQWSAQLLKTDFYMSYFWLAIVEIPSTLIVLLLMPRIGRRWTISIFLVIAGTCCALVPFLPDTASVAVAIAGKFAVCSSYTALYVFAVELFPTEIRGLGFGFCSLLGRTGQVVAPFINWLGIGSDDSIESIIRMLLYAFILLIVALLTIPLPETTNCPLPDTIEQTENFVEFCENSKRHEQEMLLSTIGTSEQGTDGEPKTE